MFSPAKTGTYAYFPSKSAAACLATACAAVFLAVTPSVAAPISAVVAACDRTPGCDYSVDVSGGITGCSAVTCFTCSPKTKECIAVRSGNKPPVKGPGLINSVLGKTPATGSATPQVSTRPAPGAPITVGNAPAGDRPGSIKPLANASTPKAQGFPLQRDSNAAGASKPDSNRKNR